MWGHGTLLLEVGQKSTMLKVGAKVQQKNDMGKKSDIFYEKYGIKSDFNGRSGRGICATAGVFSQKG